MANFDWSGSAGGVTSSAAGLGTSAFIMGCSEATIDNYSGTGFMEIGEETSAGTDSALDAADGNPIPLTTVFGLLSTFSGSSSGYGEDIIAIIRTENKKPYSLVEKKAKEIYDEYNNSHLKENQDGVSLLTESPEVATAVNEIFLNANSKHELINQLELLEQTIVGNSGVQKEKTLVKRKNK